MLISLTSVGLSGLGVPYIMSIGLWALAAGSLFTLWQRMRAVWADAKAKAAVGAPGTADPDGSADPARAAGTDSPNPTDEHAGVAHEEG
jgi:CDP-diacylglycerol--glycerol-3-phosphate 3-phosphatidyltransferase